ncbi:MAG: hypothetical protein MUC48_18145 [Leptolyngbya sp. Prado105]|nr:hypothetical protein [Leptolyngbya sp. Prado105]
MTPSRFTYMACSISLWLGIHMFCASWHPVQAQITPPPETGSPGSTAGGGSRS